MPINRIQLSELMIKSGVKFGTSGARGLASDMTDLVCYVYTTAFIQFLEKTNELTGNGKIAISGDYRPSTNRIMGAAARAIQDKGYIVENCGKLPSPALAYFGIVHQVPTVMVTGSHIPDDRNGIKYNKKDGEILKNDEAEIKKQVVDIPFDLFNGAGMFLTPQQLSTINPRAQKLYINRYTDCFGKDALRGKKIGVYQHSAVGRELMMEIYSGLGAEVTPLGYSDIFIPVDTEALRSEDIELAQKWAAEHKFDAIVSTDGDSDRPLISDENGNWLRGDVAGVLCASYLHADSVVTPVSCNTVVEKCGWFKNVARTRIGSPYVIEGMQHAASEGYQRIVGYEANGGFLTNSDITVEKNTLKALPTRDAVILHIAVLRLSMEKNTTIYGLLATLPSRFTYSDRLKNFATEKSRLKINGLSNHLENNNFQSIEATFGQHFGTVASADMTDGLRITFDSKEIVHLRPSGNAPEFRCYTEADTENRAITICKTCMRIMEEWR